METAEKKKTPTMEELIFLLDLLDDYKLAYELDISPRSVANYRNGTNPTKEVKKKIIESFRKLSGNNDNTKVSYPTKADHAPNSMSYENLTKSNLILAEAQLAGAKVQQTIADNNTALIMLLTDKSKYAARQDTPSTELSTIMLADLLAEVASGVKYDSKAAVLAELNKRMYGKKPNIPSEDIREEIHISSKA